MDYKAVFVFIFLVSCSHIPFSFQRSAKQEGHTLKGRHPSGIDFKSVQKKIGAFPAHPKKLGTEGDRQRVFDKGLRLFQQGHLLSARILFESFHRGDTNFVPALVELQKINYREKQWDRFFGLALYYRSLLLSSPKDWRTNFRQKPLALEILALIRHCRFKESQKIKEWSLNLAQSLNTDSHYIKKTANFFKLKKLIGDQKTGTQNSLNEQIHSWPLKQQELKWVDNPQNLRVKVKSQC